MVAINASKASFAQKTHSNQKAVAPVQTKRRLLAIAIHLPCGCALAKPLSLTGHPSAKAPIKPGRVASEFVAPGILLLKPHSCYDIQT